MFLDLDTLQPLGDRGRSGDACRGIAAARVLLCLYRRHLVALHGLIKKTPTTPGEDLALARKRQKELQR